MSCPDCGDPNCKWYDARPVLAKDNHWAALAKIECLERRIKHLQAEQATTANAIAQAEAAAQESSQLYREAIEKIERLEGQMAAAGGPSVMELIEAGRKVLEGR